jgi:carbamoyltransferase
MKILGLNIGIHDQGIAYICDGEIRFALEEDKARGLKAHNFFYEFPHKSLDILFSNHNVDWNSFDFIAIPLPIVEKNLKEMPQRVISKCSTFSHHKSHAMAAYFTSGFLDKTISITHDGAGTTSISKIYLCCEGLFEEVHSSKISKSGSIATLWAATTEILGWMSLKDEGKVVGLAAHGKLDNQILKNIEYCINYLGHFNFGYPGLDNKLRYLKKHYFNGYLNDQDFRSNLAYTVQYHTENIFLKFLRDVKNKYPDYNKLCLSGGLFANVKLNQAINESGIFEEIYVCPAMGDSGIALGAGILKAHEVGQIVKPFKFNDLYLGPSYNKKHWLAELIKYDFSFSKFDPNFVANELNNGLAVGVFLGRTEFGPRALGNRSILVKPTDKDAHQNLNKKLGRDDIMPFAPVILEEFANEIFGVEKSSYSAEFMTLCYRCSDSWVDKLPAVIQMLDKSARPQVLRPNVNPVYENILLSFQSLTGIPVLLNTSLNAHGEPINNYPSQVLNHLKNGMIDMIVTEDFIIKNK